MENKKNKNIEYKTVKVGKEKLSIRPLLFTSEKLLISDLCCKQFYADENKKSSMHIISLIYNMVVASLCLDKEIKGITFKTKKDKLTEIVLNLKDEDIYNFEILNLSNILKENICNYVETWNNVVEDIKLYKGFGDFLANIEDKLPTEDGQKKIVEDIKNIIGDLSSQHKQATKDTAIQTVREEVLKENKNKKK